MITLFFTGNKGSNKSINYGNYRTQSRSFNSNPLVNKSSASTVKDEFVLTPPNQRKADDLAIITQESFRLNKLNSTQKTHQLNFLI